MKKLRGIMAILAATALIFGTVACSDGGGNDNNKNTDQSEPINGGGGSGESDPINGGGGDAGGDESVSLVYKAEEITVAELNAMNPVPSAGTSTKLAAGTYSIWGGSGAIVTADKKMAVQIDTGKTTPKAIVSATNMSGSTASAVPVVGANLSSIIKDATGDKAPVNYVKVATPAAGKYAITLNISTDASSKALEAAGLSYWILATDEAGKILAVKDIGDIGGSASYTTEDVVIGTATLGETVCFGFARGSGSGGLKIHSITLTQTSKTTQAAPVAAHFVATACTTSDQNDGKIVISEETAANLESKISTGDTWADVTSLTIEDLEPGTYLFRYKETDDKLASEAIEVTVDSWVDTSIVFTQFDAADLYGNATADVSITENTAAADGTWTLFADKSNKAQVKAGTFKTYDYVEGTSGYSWTNRLSYNKKTGVTLKLKVGAGATKILRVDGGSVKDLASNESGKTNLTFTGAGEAIKWEPYVSNSTTYVEVTGDADGYVSITSTDTTNGANIYGITVVESKPATLPGAVELETKLTTAAVYSAPVIADGYTAVATQGETLTATATLTQPTKSTSTPVYADGTLGTKVEGTESVDESSVIWTTTSGEEVVTLGTGLNLAFASSTDSAADNFVPAGTYSVTASYTVGTTKYTSEPISVQVKDAGATYVTVTFNANGGNDGSVTSQDVESGVATALTSFADLGMTAPSGKEFDGWATAADGAVEYADGAKITTDVATTLYAVWKEKGSSVYELDFSKLTSLASGTKGTFTALNSSTIFFSDSLKAESVKWTAKSSSIPAGFSNPTKGLTMSSGKMGADSSKNIAIQNAVKIVTTGPATLTAYVTVQTKAKALTMDVYGADYKSIKDVSGVAYTFDGTTATLGSEVETSTATNTDAGGVLTLHAITVTLPTAGTYYLGDTKDGKIQYGYLAVEM